MIKTVLNVDKICDDCPYFSSSTSHITNYDNYHIVEILVNIISYVDIYKLELERRIRNASNINYIYGI